MSQATGQGWQVRVFEVSRPASAGVPARRVVVSTPAGEAARHGLGLCRDERARPLGVSLLDRFVALRGLASGELGDFFLGFGSALKAGMPLASSLAMAARQARTPRMRGVAGLLQQRISRGVELHEAMAELPRVFTGAQVALARAASKSGMVDAGQLFTELAAALQNDARLGRKLTGALAYPCALLCMALAAAVVLEIKALPPMVELFRAMGARLPAITEAFYAVARLLSEHAVLAGLCFLLALPSLWFGGSLLARSDSFQRALPRFWLVGPIVLSRSLARALGVFVLLRQGGANNRDIFHLAAAAAGNARVSDFFLNTHARVARGESIEEAFLCERHVLGEEGVRLAGRMEVGLEGGELPRLLRAAIAEMEERAELRLGLLPRALELPLLAACGLIIGLILLAMFLPYPSLLGDIARQMRG